MFQACIPLFFLFFAFIFTFYTKSPHRTKAVGLLKTNHEIKRLKKVGKLYDQTCVGKVNKAVLFSVYHHGFHRATSLFIMHRCHLLQSKGTVYLHVCA